MIGDHYYSRQRVIAILGLSIPGVQRPSRETRAVGRTENFQHQPKLSRIEPWQLYDGVRGLLTLTLKLWGVSEFCSTRPNCGPMRQGLIPYMVFWEPDRTPT